MGIVEPGHLLLILLIALFVFGPGRVGDLGGSLGRGVREFRDAIDARALPTVPPGQFCRDCGGPFPTNAKFCPKCGSAVLAARTQ